MLKQMFFWHLCLVNFLQSVLLEEQSWKPENNISKLFTLAPAYIGEGHGTPLQYSCLENPMDGGAW